MFIAGALICARSRSRNATCMRWQDYIKLSICLSTDQAEPPDGTGMQGFRDITRRYSRQGEQLIPFFDSSCMCSYIHVSRHVHEGFDGLNWIN